MLMTSLIKIPIDPSYKYYVDRSLIYLLLSKNY